MRRILLAVLLVCSVATHAEDNPVVTEWTKQALFRALAIDFHYNDAIAEKNSRAFTHNAWLALSGFLRNYVRQVREQRLTLHPVFIQEPTIVDSGTVLGIHYWRVNQEVDLPEINITIAFSLVVIEKTPAPNGSLLIQSMDMIKKDNL